MTNDDNVRPVIETTDTRLLSNGVTRFEDLEDSDIFSMKAKMFGQMVKMSSPHMKIHQSDLFHDARYLREDIDFGDSFWWGFSDAHTSITNRSVDDVAGWVDYLYEVETYVTDRGTWGVRFHCLSKPADTPESIADEALAQCGSKLDAIKQYRAIMDIRLNERPGLLEAKVAIEAAEDRRK